MKGTGEVLAIDERSGALRSLTASWEDVQQTRLASQQRGQDDLAAELLKLEKRLARLIMRELRQHPVWPWLSAFRGLGGVHTARVLALIGDAHRFPGARCEDGHYHAAPSEGSYEGVATYGRCGVALADGSVCEAAMLPPRPGSGVRSLWHYMGLHVVDGAAAKKRKGQQTDWNTAARTAVLMPGGLAEQIVRQRTPVYRARYDAEKARLASERPDTTPIRIEKIARTIAAKAFLGDLLIAWKGAA